MLAPSSLTQRPQGQARGKIAQRILPHTLRPDALRGDFVELGDVFRSYQQLLCRLDVAGIVDGLRPPAPRADLTHGQVIEVLVAKELTAPATLFRVRDWAYSCEAVKGLGGGRCVSRLVH